MIKLIYYQKWETSSFEYNFLNEIKKVIKDKPNKKIYFGFDYGFFCGVNIYYGSQKEDMLANKIYYLLKKEKINIRLKTNISYDFDLIVLFGYSNNEKEVKYLSKKKNKILKALTLL